MQNTAKTTGSREPLFDDRFYRHLAAGCLKISIYVYWVLLYGILIGGTGYLLYKSKLSLPWIVTPALITGFIIRKCKEHDPELREMFKKAKGKIGMSAVYILFYMLEIAIIWAVKSIF